MSAPAALRGFSVRVFLPDGGKTGYEVSFTRDFYKSQPLRTLAEIRADILAVEAETEGLLEEIIGEEKS